MFSKKEQFSAKFFVLYQRSLLLNFFVREERREKREERELWM